MDALITRLEEFVAGNSLFTKSMHLLVAVSGGVDSMVLLDVLQKAGYRLSVAHCNFNLRGDESDGDEAFVKAYCEKHKLTLHAERFNTDELAKEAGESVQMAARRLRYNWFDALLAAHEYAYVATAHHANDVAETFFVNLSRGTGLSGLTGIKPKVGNVVRPLLFATRNEMEEYEKRNTVDWRDDSSNQSVKYRRNKIRHAVIPVFEEFNPSFIPSIIKTIARLEQSNKLLKAYMNEQLTDSITEQGDITYINIKKVQELQPLNLFLYELLNPYGFNAEQVEEVEQSLTRQPGQRFLAEGYELIRDRESLIIQPLKENKTTEIYSINEQFDTTHLPVRLVFSFKLNGNDIKLKQPKTIALIDCDKLTFPLTLRCWQQGDRFHPFGMENGKLLSDFFNDAKFTQVEKEQVWILESGGKIVWVVGHRSDNRFAVTPKTQSILQIELKD